MSQIEQLIIIEKNKLDYSTSPANSLNILYNLIHLKNKQTKSRDNYIDIKKILHLYIEVVKTCDYGYDEINCEKINSLLNYLNYNEQISILKYFISILSKELPEYDKDWFIMRKDIAEIDLIIELKKITHFPKAFFLYSGLSIYRLIVVLIFLFVIINIILLPSFDDNNGIFKIEYCAYSKSFLINHILNILSLFCTIDNDFKIIPLNWFALLLVIFSKLIFVLLVVNFIFKKISNKISKNDSK